MKKLKDTWVCHNTPNIKYADNINHWHRTNGFPLFQPFDIKYPEIKHAHIKYPDIMNDFLQADAGAELKRLDKWLAKTEEKLDGGKIVVSFSF